MTNAELTFDDLMSFSAASGPENAEATGPAPLPSRRAARLQRLADAQATEAPAAPAPAPAAQAPVAPLRAVPPLEEAAQEEAAQEADVAPVAPLRAVQPATPFEPIVPAEPVSASRHVHVGPASESTAAPAPAVRQRPSAPSARSEKADRHGRFYRPELHSRWDRMSGSLVLRITVITVLLAGTGALAYVALTRFAGV